jgi:AraC-like DNA-binding protein
MRGKGPDPRSSRTPFRSLEERLSVAAAQLHGSAPGAPGTAGDFASFVRFVRCPVPCTERGARPAPWLLVVLAGSTVASTAQTTACAQAWHAVVLPARIDLELTRTPAGEEPYHGLEVEILAETLLRWVPSDLDLAAEVESWVLRPRRLGRSALRSLVEFCEGLLEPGTHPWTLEHGLAGVLLALALEESEDPLRLARAQARLDLALAIRHLIRTHPDTGWSLAQIARQLGLSLATLRRQLAQRGTGLRRLVQEERMALARTLLRDGRLNVTEVALRCGYGSPAKFARQFKNAVGVVPSHYRADREH